MTTLFAQGWALPHQSVVTIRAGDAAAIIDAILDYAPLSGLYICVCGYEVEDYDDALEHLTEAHVNDPNFDKWVAEGARSVAGQHNLLVWAFADGLLFEDEKRPGYIGPDRTDIVGL